MEFSGTYLDAEELPQLHQDHHASAVEQQQFIHNATLNGTLPAETRQVVHEDELLAAQAAADVAVAQQQQHGNPGGVFANVVQGLLGKNRDVMIQYWQETINSIEHDELDFKNHQLPLARIKKVMKTDDDVKMISVEAPILFAKGCDVFITELSMRAWIHAEENKRRTLQKSDIAAALSKSDMFDFLIDVVPRKEEKPMKSYSHLRSNYAQSPLQLNLLNQQHMQHFGVRLQGPAYLLLPHTGPGIKREPETPRIKSDLLQLNVGMAAISPHGLLPHKLVLHHPREGEKPELYSNYSHYEGSY